MYSFSIWDHLSLGIGDESSEKNPNYIGLGFILEVGDNF
jgi:hypothetical protein